jgi:hypothetical protein
MQASKLPGGRLRVEHRQDDGTHYAAHSVGKPLVRKLFASFMAGRRSYLKAVAWEDVTQAVAEKIRKDAEEAEETSADGWQVRRS